MYADRKLRFAKGIAGIGRGKAHIEISETAKLRRLYVLAALKTDTLTDLKQAISKVWRKTNRPDRPPGCKSVYRWKTRFLESGSDIRALEDEQRMGNRIKRCPSEVLEICEQSVDTVYMRRERKHPNASSNYGIAASDTTTGEAAGGRHSGVRPAHGSLRA